MVDVNKLYFNSVEIVKLEDGSFEVKPNFACPICNNSKAPSAKIFTKDVVSSIDKIVSERALAIVAKNIELAASKLPLLPVDGKGIVDKDILAKSDVININQLVEFTMPCCNTKVSLYVAVYKKEEDDYIKTCVSVMPIDEEWYNVPEEKT